LYRQIKRLKQHFEPTGPADYALVPYYLLRLLYAWVAMWVLGYWRHLRDPELPLAWALMWGRREDPSPVICWRCLWAGMRRWTVHTYYDDHNGDVEPVDECPRCGLEI